jgi:hypothetical protein
MMVQIQSHILLSKVNEQLVAFNTKKNEYHVINEMGRIFLDKLSEGITYEEASKEIAKEYDISVKCLNKDLMAFLQSLLQKGLVVNQ